MFSLRAMRLFAKEGMNLLPLGCIRLNYFRIGDDRHGKKDYAVEIGVNCSGIVRYQQISERKDWA